MQRQFDSLNEIVQEMYFWGDEEYQKYRFEYAFNPDEGWYQYGLYVTDDDKEYLLQDIDYSELDRLSQELHDEMQSHTGGDWRKFILTIDENGEAKTKFIYEIQSCMDEFKDDD